MSNPSTIPDAAERRPYVRCKRPRCPRCDSINLHSYKTTQRSIGDTMRHTKCRTCGTLFYLVMV